MAASLFVKQPHIAWFSRFKFDSSRTPTRLESNCESLSQQILNDSRRGLDRRIDLRLVLAPRLSQLRLASA